MEPIRKEKEDRRERLSIREEIEELKDIVSYKDKRDQTKTEGKPWKSPFKWRWKMNKARSKSSQQQNLVLVFFLNVKGDIEEPMLLPLYEGNMVIVRNKPYEVDPRAFWMLTLGKKQYKVLIYKEIDRRPVSNLDYTEIKKRGDATDSDEFLIKAALRAQQSQIKQQINKAAIIIGGLVVVGLLIFFFTKK